MNRLFLLLALLFVTIPVTAASAQVPLTPEETQLVLKDSQNAHQVAKLTLDTVGCIMVALEQEVDWTPAECLATLRSRLTPLGLEHELLHPKVTRLIQRKMTTKRS